MKTHPIHPRNIKKVWTVNGRKVSDIHVAAPILEPGHWEDFDPFLVMMEDQFEKGAFDVHPHRGIETVSFIIDGSINHYDSATGDGGTLRKGDLQFMTAGRGVLHNETPADGESVHMLQLWVNLPREHKMTEPRYQNMRAEDVPVRHENGALIRVYSGSSGDIVSNTLNYVPVTFVEMTIDSGASVTQDLPGSYNGFIYILEGSGQFGENKVEAKKGQALWLDSVAAEELSGIQVTANENLRLVLFAGEPLNEPVVARGPFVMNTEAEITQAYSDYRNGVFHKSN
ncbi:pirin family protein [Paenibacillus faecalis]|uniref:pirin family protein n=1 Tax=Paenibacillus faecalis TaxID=2079532 RepID=UPI000D0F535D|nr:pirin-like C-terminal cupin domain-containing protein [Paenibacillus faecalis]